MAQSIKSEHPKISEFAYRIQHNKFENANQMTIEMLLALQEWISDFKMGATKKPLYQVIPEVWAQMTLTIIETKKLHAGARNALDEITPKI